MKKVIGMTTMRYKELVRELGQKDFEVSFECVNGEVKMKMAPLRGETPSAAANADGIPTMF